MSRRNSTPLPALAELQSELQAWFDTDLGQQLLTEERRLLDAWMPRMFGYHLLQVSALGAINLTEQSPAGHRFVLAPSVASTVDELALVAEVENLPLASDCVDALLLHHALDFSVNPHQALREAVRVLKPGGRLVVVGFNPMSLWGLHRLWRRRHGQVPWSGRFISHWRIHDWMKLLEMKVERVESGFFRPPWQHRRWEKNLAFCDRWGRRSDWALGAFWILSGCKESYSVTPIERGWRRRFAFPMAMAGSSSHSKNSHSQTGRAAARLYANSKDDKS